MTTISHPHRVDNAALAQRTKEWFDARNFETKVLESGGVFEVKARKSSWWRAAVGADRALNVDIRTLDGGETAVTVGQGDWTTNVVSNAAWLALTGGANLAVSGWSFVIQKQLETHIREVLQELSRLDAQRQAKSST